jgi:hypothetical protein
MKQCYNTRNTKATLKVLMELECKLLNTITFIIAVNVIKLKIEPDLPIPNHSVIVGIRRQVYKFDFSQQLSDIFWSKSNATNIKLGIAWVSSVSLGFIRVH